mgnify:CR=1 FL=1
MTPLPHLGENLRVGEWQLKSIQISEVSRSSRLLTINIPLSFLCRDAIGLSAIHLYHF